MLTRRDLFPLALSSLIATAPAKAGDRAEIDVTIAEIEAKSGGRLGVALLDTASGELTGHRLDERFPMCSTFKVLAVAAVLARVDAGQEQLGRRIPITQADLLSYAPVTKTHLDSGMTVAELCEAAITLSDNTAANLLLASFDGPPALTRYLQSLGDSVTRVDRIEPDLNEATPGDPRDTTTPAAMAKTVAKLVTGSALSATSREMLIGWMIDCKTGAARLRAGLPSGWRIGDKTGSGSHGSANDVAVIWPQNRAPLIVTSYLTETDALSDEKRNAVHAEIGRIVARQLS
ncbi:putative Beta-lactamase [Bradyrhizobium sp. STM 3843]|uniref:class A beta-lactamase n=1 Tax=Bradyrhizobium sp. STM 3843 TaxID=551947 RepID=UPI0002404A03|nr:class A beta-lactamase [Bradyrhizobium sp. STM 3843]CCE11694.1 putative Beta-lactamase [Bradyrhizobium sp. STM 3843]